MGTRLTVHDSSRSIRFVPRSRLGPSFIVRQRESTPLTRSASRARGREYTNCLAWTGPFKPPFRSHSNPRSACATNRAISRAAESITRGLHRRASPRRRRAGRHSVFVPGPGTLRYLRPRTISGSGPFRGQALPFASTRGAASRGLGQLITTHEHVGRNIQPFGQPANHFERQRPHSIENFGRARNPMWGSRSFRVGVSVRPVKADAPPNA